MITPLDSLAALNLYFRGGAFTRALEAVGDVHFAAALQAMNTTTSGRETDADIREARGHLRTAHVAYRRYWRRREQYQRYSKGELAAPLTLAAVKDIVACRLLSYTYAYFGEWAAALEWLDKEQQAHDFHPRFGLFSLVRIDALVAVRALMRRHRLAPIEEDRARLVALRDAT
jgi:hypothetical protein